MADSSGGVLCEAGAKRYRIEHPLAVNVKDGSVLVHVPEGEFEMGSAEGKGSSDERPKHRVKLSGYWIGVYAVTNAQYVKFMQATGHRAPDGEDHKQSGKAEHPVVNVSWDDAQAYAKWAGCELASEAQWERACRGPLGLEYPWGDEWDKAKCRNSETGGSETTSVVYGYPKGASGFGTYNQSGNVWEWCGDWYDGGYYGKSEGKDPKGPAGGSSRVYRGGGWRDVVPDDFRAAYRFCLDPGDRCDFLGLRLVRAAS